MTTLLLTSSLGTSPLVPALFCQYLAEYAIEFLAASQEHPLHSRNVIQFRKKMRNDYLPNTFRHLLVVP